MSTYLIMGKFTEQGIKNVKETTKRAERFKEIAQECGVTVTNIMWLMGEYDVINIVEAKDDASLAALLLRVGAWGNVKTTTYRAFSREEMNGILNKME
ncbi:MAG: GYD family protein [Nitrospinae bacterium CG11_big_fil_rev_8_21_14_0_20_56_8]|nr:MAG: GYD family protein [Nitrospinae bacterium CG11_big_fil_rev_8_21_14_0_20_56_8]